VVVGNEPLAKPDTTIKSVIKTTAAHPIESTDEPAGETIDADNIPPDGPVMVVVVGNEPPAKPDSTIKPVIKTTAAHPIESRDELAGENIDADNIPPDGPVMVVVVGNEPPAKPDSTIKPVIKTTAAHPIPTDGSGIVEGNEPTTVPATESKPVVESIDANAFLPVSSGVVEGNEPATVPDTTKKPIFKTLGKSQRMRAT
jgi:hypothetical protein